jgi:hypothetical protein
MVLQTLRKGARLACILVLLAAAGAETLQAQTFGRAGDVESVGTAYRVFTRPGEATVQILVMGLGGGIYEVGESTRLDELLALIGGAQGVEIGQQSSAFTRETTVRLYRLNAGERTLIYEAPIEQMLLEPGQHPALRDGDFFAIEIVNRDRLNWRDGLRLLSSVGTLVLVIDRLVGRL